jgi:hypothetical protein
MTTLRISAIAIGVMLTLSFSAAPAHAQATIAATDFTKVGLSGGQFLKIGVGARATGMAGAHSAVANDLTSIFWNPAGLALIKKYAADFSQTFWFGGMQHNFAAAVIPVSDNYRLAASFTSFSSGDIRITTMDQQDGTGGIYQVSDVALGLTFAGQLTEQFSFGVTAKYISMGFTNMNADGVLFDVGTRYETGFEGVVLGFNISSLGTQMEYTGSDVARSNNPIDGINTLPIDMRLVTSPFDMPLSFRMGIGADLCKGALFEPEVDESGVLQHSLITAVDFETFSDVREQFAFGAEYTWKEFISVRAGYRMGSDQFGLAGGVGIRYVSEDFSGRIDYSLNPTIKLGLINRISIAMRFD